MHDALNLSRTVDSVEPDVAHLGERAYLVTATKQPGKPPACGVQTSLWLVDLDRVPGAWPANPEGWRTWQAGGLPYFNAESRAAWQQVVELLGRAGARPQVDEVFPFDQLPQAFERLSQGPMGKVLLAVARAGERGSVGA